MAALWQAGTNRNQRVVFICQGRRLNPDPFSNEYATGSPGGSVALPQRASGEDGGAKIEDPGGCVAQPGVLIKAVEAGEIEPTKGGQLAHISSILIHAIEGTETKNRYSNSKRRHQLG